MSPIEMKMERMRKDCEFMMGEDNDFVVGIHSDNFHRKINLEDLTIDNIEELIPVDNVDFYVSKIYPIYLKIKNDPENRKVRNLVANDIQRRYTRALGYLIRNENQEYPKRMENVRKNLMEGFGLYQDGLLCFSDYLIDNNDDFILDSLELIYRGDLYVMEAEREMEEEMEECRIIAVA